MFARDEQRPAPRRTTPVRGSDSYLGDPLSLAALQRGAGNAAVARLLSGDRSVQRCGGEKHPGCECAKETSENEEDAGLPVQRAKIDFTNLTWGDFKAGAKGAFPAFTFSGMHPVPTKLKQTTTEADNGVPCKTKKGKPDSEFTATRGVDPTAVAGIKAYMWQEKSGVQADYRKGLVARTAKDVGACVKHFAKQEAAAAKQAAKDCKALAKDCKAAFADGNASFSAEIGDTTLEATTAGECSTVFGKECREAAVAANELGEFTSPIGTGPTKACPAVPEATEDVTATSKADCTADYKDRLSELNQTESDRLLAHEQLHFAISHKFAEDLRAVLEETAEGLNASEVECGKAAAAKAAKQTFGKLNAHKELTKLWKLTEKDRVATQKQYDAETCHGLDAEKQNDWTGKF